MSKSTSPVGVVRKGMRVVLVTNTEIRDHVIDRRHEDGLRWVCRDVTADGRGGERVFTREEILAFRHAINRTGTAKDRARRKLKTALKDYIAVFDSEAAASVVSARDAARRLLAQVGGVAR